MTFPNIKEKYRYREVFSPKNYLKYVFPKTFLLKINKPHSVILCYSKKLMDEITRKHPTKKLKGFFTDIYLLKETKNKVAVVGGFGIGSPAAAALLDELATIGVKEFVSIGIAGILQKNIKLGDIILCDKAIRDEGTSHHYIKPSKYAYPSKRLTNEIENKLKELNIKYHKGASWTIDAPYRETIKEVMQYQKEGVLTVEMEASALFAVGKKKKVKVAAIFLASDSLAELKWKPNLLFLKNKTGLKNLFDIIVEVLK